MAPKTEFAKIRKQEAEGVAGSDRFSHVAGMCAARSRCLHTAGKLLRAQTPEMTRARDGAQHDVAG